MKNRVTIKESTSARGRDAQTPSLSPETGQDQQKRQEEEHLARQGQEDCQTGFSNGLEEVPDDDLAADERKGQHADDQTVGRQADERGVIREKPGNAAGKEDAGQRDPSEVKDVPARTPYLRVSRTRADFMAPWL